MASTYEIIEFDFKRAVSFVNERAGSDLRTTDDEKLEIYALYKQATVGDATDATKSSHFNLLKRGMWDAWRTHKGTPKQTAMEVRGYRLNSTPFNNALFVRPMSAELTPL